MKNLKINRDINEPSDAEILKFQNFDEVLKRSGESPNKTNQTSSNWMWKTITGASIFSIVVVASFVLVTNTASKASYSNDNLQFVKINQAEVVFNNEAVIIEPILIEQSAVNEAPVHPKTEPQAPIQKQIYLEPKIASTLLFKFDAAFNIESQCKMFPELAIYDNISFQPIGDYQVSWLKIKWEDAELVNDAQGYYLLLTKNGNTTPCPVVPVFDKENYLQAVDVYLKNK